MITFVVFTVLRPIRHRELIFHFTCLSLPKTDATCQLRHVQLNLTLIKLQACYDIHFKAEVRFTTLVRSTFLSSL